MQEQIFTSGFLILGIFSLRFIFGNHIQQRIKYALWLLVLIKLLLPCISFENPYSLIQLADKYKSTIWTTKKDQNILTEPAVQGKPILVKNKRNQNTKYGKIPQQAKANESTTAGIENIYTILYVIWLAGAVFTGVCLLAANIRFSLLLKSNRKEMPNKKDCSIQIYESTVVNDHAYSTFSSCNLFTSGL